MDAACRATGKCWRQAYETMKEGRGPCNIRLGSAPNLAMYWAGEEAGINENRMIRMIGTPKEYGHGR